MLATDSHFRTKNLLIAALIFSLFFAVGGYAINHYESILKQQQRLSVEKNLLGKASTLTQIINHRFALLYGVRAFVLTNLAQFDNQGVHSDPAAVNLYLKELYESIPDIRNVTISPGGIHQYIYPGAERSRMLGHNLLTDKRPHVRKKIQQTIESKQIGLSGPYPLRQDGSLGLIARLPIYHEEQFWGLATMVFNVTKMLEAGHLIPSDGFTLQIAGGDVFYGPPATFEGNPLITSISLPDGQWQIALPFDAPGLPTNVKVSLSILITLLALFASSLFFILSTRRWYLQLKVEKATRQLKEQGEKLRESGALLKKTQEIAHLGSWKLDVITNQLSWSDEVYRIFGLSPQEVDVTYETFLKAIHPDDRVAVDAAYYESIQDGRETYELEHRIVRGDNGKICIVHEKCSHIRNASGQVECSIGMVQDITKRKQAEIERLELETQLRHKYKMEAVGVMAGGIAHNFNNSLAIILGNVEAMQRKLPEGSGLVSYLSNAKIAILRSRDLIMQLLNYSRSGTYEQILIRLAGVIDETLKLLSSTIPATINLRQSISDDSQGVHISAEPSQIHEALVNLCNNAVQAMEEKGELTVSLETIELQAQDFPADHERTAGSYARLSVQDTGCGMTDEILETIFDPFFTTKDVNEGTGMGLSAVQGVVDKHAGLIKVKSTPGQGSTFELYFPIIETPSPETTASGEDDLPVGDERILFLDDEEMLAKLGEGILSEVGYQVTAATSSAKVLEMFQTDPNQFDLVITDQSMPNMSGKELITELLKIRADLPTILFTGYSSKINEEEAQQLGIKAFCMKPMDMSEVARTVRRVLDEAKEISTEENRSR